MKPDVILGLESAAWPTLLVNTEGVLLLTNEAARNFFGATLNVPSPQLAAIWSPENGSIATDFLALWQQQPRALMELKFRAANGSTSKFATAICHFYHAGRAAFLLQLLSGISANHGGGVAISSQSGWGAPVRVPETGVPDTGLRGEGTVLVVDDESLLLTMAETILSDFGYTVLTAQDGVKALQILARPDAGINLVITDLVMPGMGGRELMERIRQSDAGMPILCTSGYVVPEGKLVAAGYLRKPFTSTELLRKVQSVLRAGEGVGLV